MEDFDNIDDQIRDAFQNNSREAPKDIWRQLAEELHAADPVDAVVRDAFRNNVTRAPEAVWTKINRQLQLDHVWARLTKSLDPAPIIMWRRAAQIAGWLLLPVLLIVLVWLLPDLSAKLPLGKQLHTVTRGRVLHAASVASRTAYSGVTTSRNTSRQHTAYHSFDSSTGSVHASALPFIHRAGSAGIQSVSEQALDATEEQQALRIGAGTFDQVGSSTTTLSQQTSNAEQHVAIAPPIYQLPVYHHHYIPITHDSSVLIPLENDYKWTVGLTAAYNNTWVINNTTRAGWQTESTVLVHPAFAWSYGLSYGYQLTDRYSIVAETFVLSRHRQAYSYYNEGTFLEERNVFDYMKQMFLLQRTIGAPRSAHVSYLAGAGVGVAYLHAHQHNLGGRMSPEHYGDYRKWDAAIKLTVARQHHWSRYSLRYGLHAEGGMLNIFKGNQRMSAGFNATRNAVVGASVTFLFDVK